MTFYKEDFSRLPGYPQIDSDGNLKLAIYSNVAGTGVLSSSQLLQAVQASQADIEASFGKIYCAFFLFLKIFIKIIYCYIKWIYGVTNLNENSDNLSSHLSKFI